MQTALLSAIANPETKSLRLTFADNAKEPLELQLSSTVIGALTLALLALGPKIADTDSDEWSAIQPMSLTGIRPALDLNSRPILVLTLDRRFVCRC